MTHKLKLHLPHHQLSFTTPAKSYVSTNGGGSSLGDAELFSKILNLVLLSKITSTYVEGDPFLAKLQEIDHVIKKFDHVPCENPGDLSASVSSLDGLKAARDKVEEIVDNPLPIGPQVNEPILPSSVVNHPITTPPLQDLSNTDGLPTKLNPKRTSKLLKPPISSHLCPSTSVKKRGHFPEDISDTPVQKEKGMSSDVPSLSNASSVMAVPQPRHSP